MQTIFVFLQYLNINHKKKQKYTHLGIAVSYKNKLQPSK